MSNSPKEERLFWDWYKVLGRSGDPIRRPHLTLDAFKAGYAAGYAQGERDADRSTATEAMWKERQGEDYGSY